MVTPCQQLGTAEFIDKFREADINALALKIRQFPEVDAAFALQQIEGWQKCRHKVPAIAVNNNWHYPKRLSLEQCSSESACRYKTTIVRRLLNSTDDDMTGADLTGGLGADTLFLAPLFSRWYYVERDAELCSLAEHNFKETNIVVRQESAEEFLQQHANGHLDMIYIDPARRDSHGKKVVRLSDCMPDVSELYPALVSRCDLLLIKLSPMHDLHEALRAMPQATEAHVVAVDGEVKELLIVSRRQKGEGPSSNTVNIYAANITATEEQVFTFNYEEERQMQYELASSIESGDCLLEPNAAILKAGAFKTIAGRYGLTKADHNTHLYLSPRERSTMYGDTFPGRILQVQKVLDKRDRQQLTGTTANVICRNYPLKADELKKKMRLKDGGDIFIIGLRLQGKPMLLQCSKI